MLIWMTLLYLRDSVHEQQVVCWRKLLQVIKSKCKWMCKAADWAHLPVPLSEWKWIMTCIWGRYHDICIQTHAVSPNMLQYYGAVFLNCNFVMGLFYCYKHVKLLKSIQHLMSDLASIHISILTSLSLWLLCFRFDTLFPLLIVWTEADSLQFSPNRDTL